MKNNTSIVSKILVATGLLIISIGGVSLMRIEQSMATASHERMASALERAAHAVMSSEYISNLAEVVDCETQIDQTRDTSRVWVLKRLQRASSEKELVAEATQHLNDEWGEDWTYIAEAFGLNGVTVDEFMLNKLETIMSYVEFRNNMRQLYDRLGRDDYRRYEKLGWIWFGQNEQALEAVLTDDEMMALYRLTSNDEMGDTDLRLARNVASRLGGEGQETIRHALIERGFSVFSDPLPPEELPQANPGTPDATVPSR